MSGQAGPGLDRVPVAKATKAQLMEFASAVMQRTDEDMAGVTAEQLRTQVREAGFENHIFVSRRQAVQVDGAAPARIDLKNDRRMDPETERWVLCEIFPEHDEEGNELAGQAFVSVNEDFAYLPKGHRIWIRETLYHHMADAQEVTYKEVKLPSPPGYPPNAKRVRVSKPEHPHQVLAVGPPVMEDLPDIGPADLLITPKYSQHAAISLAQQSRRAQDQMLVDGDLATGATAGTLEAQRAAEQVLQAHAA